MNKVMICVILGLCAAVYIIMWLHRQYENHMLKAQSANTYAIQNVQTGMDIRPYNAGWKDGTKIVQYTHHRWECETWQMIRLSDGSFLLQNLYSRKTFQPDGKAKEETELMQFPLEASAGQYWEFIEAGSNSYYIRLKGTELYVVPSSDKNNAALILKPLMETELFRWTLVEQHPTA